MATYIKNKNKLKPHTIRYWNEGKQREISFRTKREADDWKAKFEYDSRSHVFVDPRLAGEKFGLVAQRWLARHPGSANTHRTYEIVLRLHILPEFGERSLNAVAQDREGLEHFIRSTLPAKGIGVSMIRSCAIVIRAIVNDAIRSGRLSGSKLSGVKLPASMTRLEIPFASQRDIRTLASLMPEPYGYTVYLMRGCGLRCGEALGVRTSDFLGIGNTLRLQRQMATAGVLGPLKHRLEGEYRDVPVPQYVLNAQPRGWDSFYPINRRTYHDQFVKARKLAGLPDDLTPHTLRHMFASASLAAGIPITDVSKWLGHQNIQVTFGIYGHLMPESFERARGVLDEEWGE